MAKICKCCGRELPESEYSINKSTKDGKQSYCKECSKTMSRVFKFNGSVDLQGRKLLSVYDMLLRGEISEAQFVKACEGIGKPKDGSSEERCTRLSHELERTKMANEIKDADIAHLQNMVESLQADARNSMEAEEKMRRESFDAGYRSGYADREGEIIFPKENEAREMDVTEMCEAIAGKGFEVTLRYSK